MAVNKVLQIGQPSLIEISLLIEDVRSETVVSIFNDLKDTLRAGVSGGIGIGISAPQIGRNSRIFITELPVSAHRTIAEADEVRIFINPIILEQSEEKSLLYEGCSSVAEGRISGPVFRSKIIKVQAYDLQGKKFTLKCDGILARVILHEFDHLDGILFLKQITSIDKLVDRDYYLQNISKTPELQNARKITIKEIEYLPL